MLYQTAIKRQCKEIQDNQRIQIGRKTCVARNYRRVKGRDRGEEKSVRNERRKDQEWSNERNKENKEEDGSLKRTFCLSELLKMNVSCNVFLL